MISQYAKPSDKLSLETGPSTTMGRTNLQQSALRQVVPYYYIPLPRQQLSGLENSLK